MCFTVNPKTKKAVQLLLLKILVLPVGLTVGSYFYYFYNTPH